MPAKILVVYDPAYGHAWSIAQAVKEGAEGGLAMARALGVRLAKGSERLAEPSGPLLGSAPAATLPDGSGSRRSQHGDAVLAR